MSTVENLGRHEFSEGILLELSCIEAVAKRFDAEYFYNEELAGHTSFNIGGKCDMLVKANSAECIRALVGECKSVGIKYRILGKGSNILVSDNGVDGVIILISNDFGKITVENESIICEAGAALIKACTVARDATLTGLEFAFGIPGTVGGGLYMNAGAYGGEMKDVVEYCDYLDDNGEIKRMSRDEMQLSYRHSVFSENGHIILSVCFKLVSGNKDEISAKMNELMGKRRDKQPLEYPSAGSTFKRPEGYFAAKLIEDSGLKGYTVGGAQVSEKHSGFVINKDNASYKDVVELISYVKEKVFADSGVTLEREVIIWDK